MFTLNRLSNKNNFYQKLKELDFILLACILLLGFISLTTMYSTDGGEVLFHTRSHFTKFFIFTSLMLLISFLNIRFWFSIGYVTYIIVIAMLIWTVNFGVTASGSQRWIDLYFIAFLTDRAGVRLSSIAFISDVKRTLV